MATDRESKIREKAYRLWEDEGQPHGRHDEHWDRASRAHDDEVASDPAPAPVDATTPVAVPGGMTAGAETPVPAAKPKRAAKAPPATASATAPAPKKPATGRKRTT